MWANTSTNFVLFEPKFYKKELWTLSKFAKTILRFCINERQGPRDIHLKDINFLHVLRF